MVSEDGHSRVSLRMDVMQSVLNYLLSRPAGETWEMIAKIHADVVVPIHDDCENVPSDDQRTPDPDRVNT